MFKSLRAATLCTAAAITLTASGQAIAQPKPASPATVEAQRAAAALLPPDGERDKEFVMRGFIGTQAEPLIKDDDGNVVWNLAAYDFVQGPAPATVNPSLWRHMRYLKHHGLFQLTENSWQVRGFDLSNMTVVRGETGWILIDPLTSAQAAKAALALVNAELGERPVTAVIYSHSHADHFGGVRGVVDEADVKAGKTAIIAPEGFVEEASSENVMAGSAMTRRAAYQFGRGLTPGAQGQMGSGIGPAVSTGTITLIAPTDIIRETGETRVVDGVELEFQIVSGSEAPAELNVYVAPERALLTAEIATCTMHNILTPRGAKVRDTHAWAHFLDEAARRYAPKADVVASSHCWPMFGTEAGVEWLSAQRDNYRYLHDQTVRRMNSGSTMVEIAEDVPLPANLGQEWSNHGYYGTYNHNSKAIYQFYLGWYDAVPANLNAHPPVERAKRSVQAMGGADRVIALARIAMTTGDYRWSSDLLQQLVFAEPDNDTAKALLADSYEQQGYQAESAIWRNQFLVAADELRNGAQQAFATQSPDMIQAIDTGLLLDSAAARFDPTKLGRGATTIQLNIIDRGETAVIEANDRVMIGRVGETSDSADVTISGPRQAMLGMLFLKMPVAQMQAAGVKVDGDPAAMQALIDALDTIGAGFNIVEP